MSKRKSRKRNEKFEEMHKNTAFPLYFFVVLV